MDAPDRLWSTEELAAYLGVPVTTVYQWRLRKYGPLGVKVGRYLRFRPHDVERWLDEQQKLV